MDLLKRFFPFSFRGKKDVAALIINILIYIIVGAVVGFLIGILAKIPVINLITGIVGTIVEIYVIAGIVMFVGILLYNFAIRLVPKLIKLVYKLFLYVLSKLKELFNYLRRESAKL